MRHFIVALAILTIVGCTNEPVAQPVAVPHQRDADQVVADPTSAPKVEEAKPTAPAPVPAATK